MVDLKQHAPGAWAIRRVHRVNRKIRTRRTSELKCPRGWPMELAVPCLRMAISHRPDETYNRHGSSRRPRPCSLAASARRSQVVRNGTTRKPVYRGCYQQKRGRWAEAGLYSKRAFEVLIRRVLLARGPRGGEGPPTEGQGLACSSSCLWRCPGVSPRDHL